MQIDLKNVQFFMLDGTSPTPNKVELIIGEGNLTYQEFNEMEYKKNRGKLANVRKGDEKPVEVSMDFRWDKLKSDSGAGTPTPKEILTQTGLASTWVTAGPDPCEPYAIILQILNTPICASGTGAESEKELITIGPFRPESFNHDPKTGQVQCSGKANVTAATVTHPS